MTETDIQQRIRLALSKYGVVLRMNVGSFQTKDGRYMASGLPKGTSDLLFIGNGYVTWIEVKTPQGRPSREQEKFIEKMRSLGHRAGIARSVEDALKLCEIKEETKCLQ